MTEISRSLSGSDVRRRAVLSSAAEDTDLLAARDARQRPARRSRRNTSGNWDTFFSTRARPPPPPVLLACFVFVGRRSGSQILKKNNTKMLEKPRKMDVTKSLMGSQDHWLVLPEK
ncbi:hypothetical protein AVEN_175816-1 [Araneus ventricosus]|uniref:Uncharacterized protein n=1 Tax=Araneus ventricosus TaxID=182803 RepID=A0A4Y2F108_ARAVE|nr:hypothetical protein AVEN_175816-1 [Araneus ventricosus]